MTRRKSIDDAYMLITKPARRKKGKISISEYQLMKFRTCERLIQPKRSLLSFSSSTDIFLAYYGKSVVFRIFRQQIAFNGE